MNSQEFINKAHNIPANYTTFYVNGCFGASMTAAHKERYINNGTNWNREHADLIRSYPEPSYGFDCVGLVKGILWGWNGDYEANYGGAQYASNGVPDATIEFLMRGYSDDFSTIVPGELVAMKSENWGHIGIYIGNGLVIESTPGGDNGVQLSRCNNVASFDYPRNRTWDCHVKCQYIDYTDQPQPEPQPEPQPTTEQPKYRILSSRWYSEMVGLHDTSSCGDDYAGIFGTPMKGFACNCGRYRSSWGNMHWLPYVTGYNISDYYNGYAGKNGEPLTGLEIDDSSVHVQLHTINDGWLEEGNHGNGNIVDAVRCWR